MIQCWWLIVAFMLGVIMGGTVMAIAGGNTCNACKAKDSEDDETPIGELQEMELRG